MEVAKPASVASDPFKSSKWDELTEGRDLAPSDAPILAVLCQWYAVAQKCMDDLDEVGQVAYTNDMGDLRALPQIATMKQASAEIRALSKQLGVAGGGERDDGRKGGTVLELVRCRRAERVARASGEARAG